VIVLFLSVYALDCEAMSAPEQGMKLLWFMPCESCKAHILQGVTGVGDRATAPR